MSRFFNYKNKDYKLQNVGRMKHPDTGEWINCAIYLQIESGDLFCRSLDDFTAKFKPIEDQPVIVNLTDRERPIIRN